MNPLLSICIPSYNRAELLSYCLENLRALDATGISYEVVVVDHASTDRTPEMLKEAAARWDNVRYFRQTQQVGFERQFVAAFRMGRGKYTIYLSDDDKIIPERLAAYVRDLEANPDVAVIYANWWAYDDAEEKILHGYFDVPQRTSFARGEALPLIDFMTARTIYPETGVYRSAALHEIVMTHKDGAYFAFLIAQALAGKGAVVFGKEPFYLEVAVTKPQFTRAGRVNMEINLSHLDNLRAGMEIMIERSLLAAGGQKVPDHLRANIHETLLKYTHDRLTVAFRRALAAKHFVAASEIAQRIMLWRGMFQPDLAQLAEQIYALTGLQAVAQLVGCTSWVEKLYIHGFHQPEVILRELGYVLPGLSIEAADEATILAHPDPGKAAVLVKTPAERAPFLGSGLMPGNVLALKSLADYYQLIPAPRNFDGL